MNSTDPMLPRRNSLVNECVRVMKARIAAGEWSEYLPGERRLAQILNVGRDTIRLTLSELAAGGVILPGEIGKQRKIAEGCKPVVVERSNTWRIGMLSPFNLERLSQSMLAEVDQIRSIIAQRGGVLDLIDPPWYETPQPERRLLSLLESDPRDAWILYRSSRAIQSAFQASRTPCMIRGYPHPGIDLPYMDYDWTATGRHAVGELWRKGHRHICLVMPRDGLRGNIAAWQGAVSFAEERVKLTEIWDDGTTAGLVAAFEPCIAMADPPTAFVMIRPRQTITLLTWLGSKGYRVPRDFSLISLATEPMLAHIVPTVTTYHIDPSVFAKRVARHLELLVEGRIGSQGSLLLMPDLVPGASIAAR
ncbi:MAG: substrate-binding domain-containing protein [Verrucomicrobia bacterium]|nr:substrate-binding domain-containing protein [Verrucomicrobiota bacterium]